MSYKNPSSEEVGKMMSKFQEDLVRRNPFLANRIEFVESLAGAKRMLRFLDYIPEYLKVGPWSPAAYAILFAFSLFLLFTTETAINAYVAQSHNDHPYEWLQTFRLLGGLYGLTNTLLTFYFVGIWPFASYTLTSWNFMTLRLLFAYLAGAGYSIFNFPAELFRFPALVGCTITVFVWWLVLVPLIDHLLRNEEKERKFFWKFNSSPSLINVHLLNLPLIAIDFLFSGQYLTFFDLWTGYFVALLYVLFYLNVLDPMGLHFYIVFTPRSAWCLVSYGIIILSYFGLYLFWNELSINYMK